MVVRLMLSSGRSPLNTFRTLVIALSATLLFAIPSLAQNPTTSSPDQSQGQSQDSGKPKQDAPDDAG
jgi:hypothetical protein